MRARWWTDELDVLGSAECAQWRALVHHHAPAWTRRHKQAPFFTLGAAAYLDATGGRYTRYAELAARVNPVLGGSFGTLLEEVRCILEAYLGDPVEFAQRLGLPGFHVFLAHPLVTRLSATVHFDLQHTELHFAPEEEASLRSVISFTLPLAVPSAGAGLEVWDLHLDDVPPGRRNELARDVAARRHWVHGYSPGRMVIHSGLWAHRIAPTPVMQAGDERITLQGHAVETRHGWVAYW